MADARCVHNILCDKSLTCTACAESELSACRERERRMREALGQAAVYIRESQGYIPKFIDAALASSAPLADTPQAVAVHPEAFCQECGGANPGWFAPNVVWNELVPQVSGILCPNCFMKRNPDVTWKVEPEAAQAVAVPCGAVMGTINGEPFLCNATAGHEGNHGFTQSWQAVATPDLVEQAKIYFQWEYDRDRTQSIFVGMAKFAAMHAASLAETKAVAFPTMTTNSGMGFGAPASPTAEEIRELVRQFYNNDHGRDLCSSCHDDGLWLMAAFARAYAASLEARVAEEQHIGWEMAGDGVALGQKLEAAEARVIELEEEIKRCKNQS